MGQALNIFINTHTADNDQLDPTSPPTVGLFQFDFEFGYKDGSHSNEYIPDDVELLSYDIQGDVDVSDLELLKEDKEEQYTDGQGHVGVRTGYKNFLVRIKLHKNTTDTYKESNFSLHVLTKKFESDISDQMTVLEDGYVEFGMTLTAEVKTEQAVMPSDYNPEDEEQSKANEKEVAAVQDQVAEKVDGMTSKMAPPIDVDALMVPIVLAKAGGNTQISNVLKQVKDMREEIQRLERKSAEAGAKAEKLRKKEKAKEEEEKAEYLSSHGGEEDPSDPFAPSYKTERLGEKASKSESDKEKLDAKRDNAVAEYCAYIKLHVLKSSELSDDEKNKIGGRHPGIRYREGMESEYGDDVMNWPDDDIDTEIRAYMEQELVTGGLGRMVKEKLVMFKQQFAAVAQGVKDLMVSGQTTAMEPMGAVVVTPTGAGSVATNIPQIFNSLKRLSAAAGSLILPITMALESARFLGLPKSVVTPLVGIARILVAINAIAGTL